MIVLKWYDATLEELLSVRKKLLVLLIMIYCVSVLYLIAGLWLYYNLNEIFPSLVAIICSFSFLGATFSFSDIRVLDVMIYLKMKEEKKL